MDTQIKKYADARDLKSLKYIFVDALDVDPTFVRYEEEYNYCKDIPDLLEPYTELTPFIQDKAYWNEKYWASLKMDLLKNFSDRRMMHMKDVAQVFLAEKVQRILSERNAAAVHSVSATPSSANEVKPESVTTSISNTPNISRAEQEQRELHEAKKKLDEENRRIEAERQAKARQLEQQRKLHQKQAQSIPTGSSSKKAIGIAVAAVVVAAVILILLLK